MHLTILCKRRYTNVIIIIIIIIIIIFTQKTTMSTCNRTYTSHFDYVIDFEENIWPRFQGHDFWPHTDSFSAKYTNG